MNRVDELTLKLLDGTLTGEERVELERLVREDAGAARAHAEMLDLVAAMRGEGSMPDAAGKTLDRIHERITEKIEVGVMHQIRASLGSARDKRGKERASARRVAAPRRRRSAWMFGLAAAAVIVAVAVALMMPASRPPEEAARITPPKKVEPPVPPPVAPEPPVRETPPPPKVETPVPPPPVPEPVRKVDKPAPVPPPVVEKKPEPKPEPVPVPEPPKPVVPLETIVVVATIEKAENATVFGKGGKAAAKAGQDLLQGQGLEAEGPVTLKYPDGTRVELRPKTLVREFTLNGGKAIDLARGVLLAQVSDQPADRPMTVVTPLAEVRILGTAFKVSVDPETEGTTQVEVTEGKVRVKRLADGKTVDVARGGVVSVGKGTEALAAHLSAGLVAHWTLDEKTGTKALDVSGNLVHAEAKGDIGWVPGRLGGGLRFGGGGQLTVRGFKAPEVFTVAFWVYQAKLTADQDWFLNFGANEFFLMREGNMDPRQVRTGFENPQQFLTVASVVRARQWTHLAVTFDGAETRLYENGASVGSKKMVRKELRPDVTFGRVGPGSEAVMDDIRIYDRALLPADLARVMAGAKR